jgi:regulator of sigma D
MIIAIIILTILVGILGYLTYINFRKAEQLEQYCEAYVHFISALYFRVADTRDKLKEVDRLGAFKADDEVGFAFKEIDNLVDDLYTFITKYVNSKDNQNTEQKVE